MEEVKAFKCSGCTNIYSTANKAEQCETKHERRKAEQELKDQEQLEFEAKKDYVRLNTQSVQDLPVFIAEHIRRLTGVNVTVKISNCRVDTYDKRNIIRCLI